MTRYAIGESVRLIYTPFSTAIRDGTDSSIKASVFERTDGKFGLAVDGEVSDTPLVPTSNIQKSVTTAGTAEQVSGSDIPCSFIRVTAKSSNSGKIYLGYANVSSTNFDFILEAEDSEYIVTDNVNKVYLDTDTDGDGTNSTYFV